MASRSNSRIRTSLRKISTSSDLVSDTLVPPAPLAAVRHHFSNSVMERIPLLEGRQRSRPGGSGSVASPLGRRPTRLLLQGRERRRDEQLVFLADRSHAGLRRPLATLAGFLADAVPLGGVLVHPHVHELVEPADLTGEAGGQRRELLAPGHGLAPRLEHLRKVA